MSRLSAFALASVLSLGTGVQMVAPPPAEACEIACATLVATGISAIATWWSSKESSKAQEAITKAQAAATIKAAEIAQAASDNMARAQIESALISARTQIMIAVMNRKAQMDLEILRNKHNTDQKILDRGLAPFDSFNKRYGQSAQPMFAPSSNRAARTSQRLGVGGFQLFRY